LVGCAVLAAVLSACGGDDDTASGPAGGDTGAASATVAPMPDDAARGEQLAQDNGCRSCHQDSDNLAPTWNGLYGSQVTLTDGTTVVADEAYLTESIRDPGARKVDGFAIAMPEYDDLSDDDIADLVAYIRWLGE